MMGLEVAIAPMLNSVIDDEERRAPLARGEPQVAQQDRP